jgi:hypothetical protein
MPLNLQIKFSGCPFLRNFDEQFEDMNQHSNFPSISTAAIISGLSLLIMAVAAPYAEMYAFPKLTVYGDAVQTTRNILANAVLFRAGTMGYLITFMCDLIASWALYILLKPANEHLSMLMAWLRLVYTVIALVAISNLMPILQLVNSPDALASFEPGKLDALIQTALQGYRSTWNFGILFFGLHLLLLGYLVFISRYIPYWLGILLLISGIGYTLNGLKPFLFPAAHLDFAVYTFFGELIFMGWLLVRGYKLKV